MSKILCPFREEKTPSMVLYPDGGYFCFGCGAHGKSKDIGYEVKYKEKYIEDIEPVIAYIRSLPARPVRNLRFRADDHCYYILWPDYKYYLRRSFNVLPGMPKYKGPAGHQRPPLFCRVTGKNTLVIVEGEINAISVAEVCKDIDVLSPGSATEMGSERIAHALTFVGHYDKILICVDNDSAGILGAISLKTNLLRLNKNIKIAAWDTDANKVLTDRGSDELRQKVEEELGHLELSRGVYCD